MLFLTTPTGIAGIAGISAIIRTGICTGIIVRAGVAVITAVTAVTAVTGIAVALCATDTKAVFGIKEQK